MLEKKHVDLLNQELDGENSERDHARVKKLIERDSEARQFYEELQQLKSSLRRIKVVDPPTALRAKILDSISARQTRRVPVSSLPFLHALASNARYRTAYAFVGGAVAGILLFAIFSSGPSETDVLGTMADPSAPVVQSEALVSIDLPQAQGTFSARKAGLLVTAQLQLQQAEALDISVLFDRTAFRFDAFRQDRESESAVTILEGELRITQAGNNSYTMTFVSMDDTEPKLTLQIRDKDVLLSEKNIVLAQKK